MYCCHAISCEVRAEVEKAIDRLCTRVERDALQVFLISNFCPVLNVVCFLLGNSPASEFYMPTFRNTLSVPSS